MTKMPVRAAHRNSWVLGLRRGQTEQGAGATGDDWRREELSGPPKDKRIFCLSVHELASAAIHAFGAWLPECCSGRLCGWKGGCDRLFECGVRNAECGMAENAGSPCDSA